VFSRAENSQDKEQLLKSIEDIEVGDVIGATGRPFRTKAGELSVRSDEITMLAPCLHMLPQTFYGLRVNVCFVYQNGMNGLGSKQNTFLNSQGY
jgi:lysyl-tRNA synthetase class II